MNWEMMTFSVSLDVGLEKVVERINEYGRDGWQPFQIMWSISEARVWLKREIE
jgi:hypothetical protein